jgi:hypothetical protein
MSKNHSSKFQDGSYSIAIGSYQSWGAASGSNIVMQSTNEVCVTDVQCGEGSVHTIQPGGGWSCQVNEGITITCPSSQPQLNSCPGAEYSCTGTLSLLNEYYLLY